MKRILQSATLVVLILFDHKASAQHVVISEVYGGGGNAGAIYKNDFIELYNPTNSPVSLTGWSVQYIAATGSGTWQVTNLSGSIAPKSYYLIQEAIGTGGTVSLPTPDATGTIAISGTSGKVALVSSTTALTGACPGSLVDEIGFGPTANCSEGSAPAPVLTNTTSAERKGKASSTGATMIAGGADEYLGNGYDSNNNANDFITRIPQPQNSLSSIEPDVTAPVFTTGYPASANITENKFDLIVNQNEIGKVYYIVLADASVSPTAAQIKAGIDDSGNNVLIKGVISVVIALTNISKTITGLDASTNYDIYVVGEDTPGNLQISPSELNVTTTISTVPAIIPSISSFIFPGVTDKAKQSASMSYSIIANNLTQDVSVLVSGNFLISIDNVSYASTISINRTLLIAAAPQTIYIKFNPGGSAGVQIGTITHSSAGATDKQIALSATSFDPFNQNFNDASFLTSSGWTQYSKVGQQVWATTNFGRSCLAGCTAATVDKAVQMNGFATTSQNNEDWLISPLLDLTAFVDFPALSFWTISAFDGDGLQLKYSSDYVGFGDPALATWTAIDGKFPATNSSLWTKSSNIILPKSSVYIALVYTSNTTAASRWTFDDWKIEDISSYLDVPRISFSFRDVITGSHSASQNFTFVSNGYGDITVSAPDGYEVSTDNSAFGATQIVSQADASSGKIIYVRLSPASKKLSWTGSINFKGIGLDASYGSLIGTSYPKSETFDVTCYNLEFFGTDARDAGGNEFGPTDDALQVGNVTTVMQTLNSDIFGVEEVSDDDAFNQLVANLLGYDKILSPRWSYSFQAPDPNFPPQKVGFIYNTSTVQILSSRVMFAKLYDNIQAGTITLPSYPGGTSSSFWSSGRLPFMITINATVNGITKKIIMIDVHAKSGSAQVDYDRRKYDVQVLHDSLVANYPNDNIILLGDYNDDVDASINVGAASSYKPFVDDAANFNVLTYALSQAGAYSFPNSNSFLDHIITSNELTNLYVNSSIAVEDARNYVSNYMNSTSDHLPVSARFQFTKNDQTITFAALDDKTVGDTEFALTATASSGLALSYSTTSNKIAITGNQITIIKPGRTTITASQDGNSNYVAATPVDQSFCIKPVKPTIVISNANTEAPLLTSSASEGNQWYLNGVIVPSATAVTLSIGTPGVYSVQARVDDCISAFSLDAPVIVAGDLKSASESIMVYPNPALNYVDVRGMEHEIIGSSILDMMGQINSIAFQKNGDFYRASIDHLPSGFYLLEIHDAATVHQIKFIKK